MSQDTPKTAGYGEAIGHAAVCSSLGDKQTDPVLQAALWHAAALLYEQAAQIERLADALREVMLWIENWSPPFTEDDEWPDTEAKAQAALHPTAAQENNDA